MKNAFQEEVPEKHLRDLCVYVGIMKGRAPLAIEWLDNYRDILYFTSVYIFWVPALYQFLCQKL